MFKKKILILAILLVSLFAVSAVSAADNQTDYVVSEDFTHDDITSSNLESNDVNYSESETNGQETLAVSESDEIVCLDDKEEILSTYSPSYSSYSLSVSDKTINYGSTGSVTISITPCNYRNYYAYDFYFRVIDSNGNQKINQNIYSTTKSTSYSYSIDSTNLGVGKYTIKLINYEDNHVMDTATLTIKDSYPSYYDYSVSVDDTSVVYGDGGTISMYITPSTSSYYKYYYYFRVYDSDNNQKISYTYYSSSSSSSRTYSLRSNQLSPGTYTIKIVNYNDDKVMDTAKLTVHNIDMQYQGVTGKCTENTQYKVRVSDNDNYVSGLEVIFTCNGDDYKVNTDNQGYAILNIHLKAGTYDITAKCRNFVCEQTINVNKVYVANKYKNLYIKSLTGYCNAQNKIKYGWQGNFEGYFKIYSGKKLLYQSKLNSNGYIGDYFQYTNHNKYYQGSAIKNVGKYRCVITDKNGKQLISRTIKIIKTPTYIKCSSFKAVVGAKKTIKLYVYDKFKHRKNVAGIVKLKIKGKTYQAKVKNGFAKIKNVQLPSKIKTYKYKVKFIGNKNFKSSSRTFKVSVRQLTSFMQAFSDATKPGAKHTIYAYVAIKNLNGEYNLAKGGIVKFIINGKTYKSKVKGGTAKVTITAPYTAKTYHCKAIYVGSKTIKGDTYKFDMVVKKPPSKYKYISLTAKKYAQYKSSGRYGVETIIYDMWRPSIGHYTYIDTFAYKDGYLLPQSKYWVKFKIKGSWTGWEPCGPGTGHNRYAAYYSDLNSVPIKVRILK